MRVLALVCCVFLTACVLGDGPELPEPITDRYEIARGEAPLDTETNHVIRGHVCAVHTESLPEFDPASFTPCVVEVKHDCWVGEFPFVNDELPRLLYTLDLTYCRGLRVNTFTVFPKTRQMRPTPYLSMEVKLKGRYFQLDGPALPNQPLVSL